jgi:hypothetical protein
MMLAFNGIAVGLGNLRAIETRKLAFSLRGE